MLEVTYGDSYKILRRNLRVAVLESLGITLSIYLHIPRDHSKSTLFASSCSKLFSRCYFIVTSLKLVGCRKMWLCYVHLFVTMILFAKYGTVGIAQYIVSSKPCDDLVYIFLCFGKRNRKFKVRQMAVGLSIRLHNGTQHFML